MAAALLRVDLLGRVLYGSDTPFNPMEWEIEKIVKHAQRHLKLKIEDLRLIMSGNIKRC